MALNIDYTPPPTGLKFMQSDAKMRVLVGPVGSGKSVTCCFEVIRRASMQEPDPHTKKRRTRCAVVRETARQLQDTTIKTWNDWFPPGVCGRYMRTTKTYFFEVGDIECEVMFRALDDADDVANLNSLELTFAWFNECRDIHPEIVDAMSKRIGRYPSSKDGGPTWYGMWGDTNPPTMDTWWYYQMEHLDPKDGVSANENGWDVFKQPSGRSPYAENIENLPEGYYDTTGRSEEYIRVFIDGEYGLSNNGKPVYQYFRPDYHMAKDQLRPIINGSRPVIVGMDLGLTPAAILGQQDPRGRALILDELVSKDMGVQRFVRTMLKPLLSERFSGAPVLVVVDPAGVQRAQTDERSAVDIIKAEGLRVIPAKTNRISARVNAVDDYLMRQVDGDPAFLLDPRCTKLKAAMMGGYRFDKHGGIDKNQHSHCFVSGTLVDTLAGKIPIEDIKIGDEVITPFGAYPVTATMSHTTDKFVDVTLTDGTSLTCTEDHPFYTQRGIVLAGALEYTDILLSLGGGTCQQENTGSKSLMVSATTGSQTGTINPITPSMAEGICTETYGSIITALYRNICAYTTKTMMALITQLRTLSYLPLASTQNITTNTGRTKILTGLGPGWRKHDWLPRSGTANTLKPRKVDNSYQSKDVPAGLAGDLSTTHAHTVEHLLSAFVGRTSEDIAALRARQQHGSPAELTTRSENAVYAEVVSRLIATGQLKHAPRIVNVSTSRRSPERVYDLTVDHVHSFIANGLWTSNCAEALQYLMLHITSTDAGQHMIQRREIKTVASAGWT